MYISQRSWTIWRICCSRKEDNTYEGGKRPLRRAGFFSPLVSDVTGKKVRARIWVEGLVQGVFYRYSTRQKAQELGLNGWVRNLPDGSVECLVEGEQDRVHELIAWCGVGPPGARVDTVRTQWEHYGGDLPHFSIRY